MRLPRSLGQPGLAGLCVPAEVLGFITRAARSDDPVLLLGETGSGKSLLAHLIHEAGSRAGRPFLVVNCPSLPDGLFERELFGHVAGAFTDARTPQSGLLEAAHGGSLLLDEVAELSLVAQAKLLAVADTGLFRRLGSPTDIHKNVRLIAATNADLRKRIDEGGFRSDLFHRLTVFRFTLAPLRDRREELPDIISFLLERAVGPARVPRLSPESLKLIEAYSWPGNIRELDHALRCAVAFTDGTIMPEHLPDEVRTKRRVPSRQPALSDTLLKQPLHRQREAIGAALRQSGNNRSLAAKSLGISRSTLWMRVKLYGLEVDRSAPAGPVGSALRSSEPARTAYRDPVAQREDQMPIKLRPNLFGNRISWGASAAHRPERRYRMDRTRHDLICAWRALRARPGASCATTLVLGLGIGLVTAVFAVADPFVLRPLPYDNPDRLVTISIARGGSAQVPSMADQMPTLSDWEARADLFSGLAGYRRAGVLRLRTPYGSAVLRATEVTSQFLDLLGVPVQGRWSFASSEDHSLMQVALTEHGRRRVLAEGEVIAGQTFPRYGGGLVQIGTTLGPGFLFPSPNVIFPVDALVSAAGNGRNGEQVNRYDVIIGRLAGGVTPGRVAASLSATLPNPHERPIQVDLLTTYMTKRVRPLAVGALMASALVLLVCLGSVATLLLARAADRAREFATRAALGASRWDLARLILFELGALATGAVLAGLGLATAALSVASRVMPVEYGALGHPSITVRVGISAGAAGALVLLLGLVPVWVAWRAATGGQTGRGGGSETRNVRVLRVALAATQSGLAIVLFIGSALLVRSYFNLMKQETGFSGNVSVLTTSYPSGKGGLPLQLEIDSTIDELQRLPGVLAVGAAVGSMLDRVAFPGAFVVDGRSVPGVWKRVTPDYFRAVGSTLVAGRGLAMHDSGGSGVLVTRSFERQAWLGVEGIGRRIGTKRESEVVGVIRDEFNFALDAKPEPTVFSLMENPWQDCSGAVCGQVSYVVRLADGAGDSDEAIRRVIANTDPDAVVVEASSVHDRLMGSVRERSFATLVLGFFAVAAVSVCLTSLVGIVAFVVTRRTREIAICIAIGATPRHVLQMVLSETGAAVGAGLAVGVLASRWASRTLEHFVYGISPGDWPTSAAAASVMVGIAAIAVLVPARRALRLSPTVALRVE